MSVQPEVGYNVALCVNVDEVASPEETVAMLVNVKLKLLGAPFLDTHTTHAPRLSRARACPTRRRIGARGDDPRTGHAYLSLL